MSNPGSNFHFYICEIYNECEDGSNVLFRRDFMTLNSNDYMYKYNQILKKCKNLGKKVIIILTRSHEITQNDYDLYIEFQVENKIHDWK